MLNDQRIRVIVGHYGSGKTEFAINYVMQLAGIFKKLAIVDLDVVNVYFRSREKANLLEKKGIKVISSSLGHVSLLDVPALTADIAAPLQDDNCEVVMDVGGDAQGTKTLARYKALLLEKGYDMFCVINANREQTQDVAGAINHIKAIEVTTGLKITGLVNNTHLVRETTVDDIITGQKLVEKVSQQLDIPIKYICALEDLIPELPQKLNGEIFPVKLYMREEWM